MHFFYGDLKEDIYMEVPKGLLIEGDQKNLVCKLHKSLYELKKASRRWFGLKQSAADHSYYFMKHSGSYLGVIIYVDDILLASTSAALVQ